MDQTEVDLPESYDPHALGEVGFPLGNCPEENIANLMTYLKGTAAKLAGGPSFSTRRQAASAVAPSRPAPPAT